MLRPYIQLVRWPNLVIVGLIFVLIKTQVIDPISELSGVPSCINSLHWWLVSLATIFIAASGNVINDIFDQDIDRHNNPERVIVGKEISEKQAWDFYYALGSIGLILGIYLCWDLGNISNSLIFMLSAGGLYFYSYSYKRQLLIGNVVVALLAGLVPFMPLYLQMMCTEDWQSLPWAPIILAYGFFAFLTTLIREVIKDMQDLKGDQMQRCSTLPIVIGMKGAKVVVVVLILALIAAVGWLQRAWWVQESLSSVFYFVLAVQVPAIAVAVSVLRNSQPQEFKFASNMTKVLMLGGILYMVIYHLTLS